MRATEVFSNKTFQVELIESGSVPELLFMFGSEYSFEIEDLVHLLAYLQVEAKAAEAGIPSRVGVALMSNLISMSELRKKFSLIDKSIKPLGETD